MLLLRIASAVLYAAAAACISLAAVNRRLILMRDSRMKSLLILVGLPLATLGCAAAGAILNPKPWMAVPLALLGLIAAGEVRRVILRRRDRGSPPVDTVPHRIRLSRPFTTTDLVCHRYCVTIPSWQGPHIRIAHLSDVHINAHIPEEYYRDVMKAAADERPDLAFFTGDFSTNIDVLPALPRVIHPIGRLGSFATLGNHDYWVGANAVRDVVRKSGLSLLTDESTEIEIDGHRVVITGCDTPWGSRKARLPQPIHGGLHLVLSHTADNIYRLSATGADVVFSGHYHAGQFRVPWLGPIIMPSVYGRRFDHGHFVVRGTHLFVASGVGTSMPPLRIYCQPDIFIVDIEGGRDEGRGTAADRSDDKR